MRHKKSQKMCAKVDFRIKLLSGNNVVMVESGGYESEIFVPIIINGRIGFQNIIPNRRCCTSHGDHHNKNNTHTRYLQHFNTLREPQCATTTNLSSKTARSTAGQETRLSPLAYSTPLAAPTTASGATGTPSSKNSSRRSHRRRSHVSITQSFCNTPELPRRDVQSVYDVAKDTLVQIPSGIKVIRLYRNPTTTKPYKNVLRVVGTNTESPLPCCHSNEFIHPPPPTPIPTQTETAFVSINEVAASKLQLPETPDLKSRSKQNKVTPTPKWRKCITPIRTYSRRQIVQRHVSTVSVNKKTHNNSTARVRNRVMPSVRLRGSVLPSYMVNPTQTAKQDVQVEVKKRKVIIDPKLNISARTFKRQQRDTSDLKNNSKYRLPTNRKEYEASKLSAFQMLTNSNRMANLSNKLNNQFRKGCVNKASSTNPRYKQLYNIPALQLDQQTKDILSRQNCENTAPIKSNQNHACRIQNVVATTRLKIPEPSTAIK